MNQTELIARVRRNAFIRDNHPDYTDQIILDELNDALRSIYLDIMTGPRQGYWLKQQLVTSVAGQQSLQVTPRAVVGGVEKVEIGEIGNVLYSLDEVTENHAQWYESFGARLGTPQYYVIRGDMVDFLPTFDHAMQIRVSYYIKPSLLVVPQVLAEAPSDGAIVAVNNVNHTVTVSSQPKYRSNGHNWSVGQNIGIGAIVDIVRATGNFELSLVNAVVTAFSANIYSFGATVDLSDVQSLVTTPFPDRVRGQNETDFPPLPEEFHRTVADAASVKIMLQLNMSSKAGTIAASVGGDLGRLRTMMATSRARNSPKTVGLSMVTFGSGRRIYPRFP